MEAELAPGPEFDRIRDFVEVVGALAPQPRAGAGPGDDAAVIEPPSGERLVVSTDISIEGVHFERAWLEWRTIGYRAVAAALSDLAAMAAAPLGILLTVALPPELDREVLGELARGVGRALATAGAPLLGGDLSRSPGPVVIDVTVLGSAARPVRRRGAKAGDGVWVTGELGGAAAAVEAWRRSLEPDPRARRAFERPVPRLAEARWLADRARPSALIDVSDGLAGDAAQLAAASAVRLEIDLETIPLAPPLDEFTDRSAALQLAVTGGEDYELLFTAPGGSVESQRGAFERELGTGITRVGRVVEGKGVVWRGAGGEEVPSPGGGFDHFSGGT
jgi:thiamine-monophosphate kinase